MKVRRELFLHSRDALRDQDLNDALEATLGSEAMAHITHEDRRLIYARHKGDDGSILTLELRLRRGRGPLGERRWLTLRQADPHRLLIEDERFAATEALSREWAAPLPVCRTDAGISVRCFPCDRRMPRLPSMLRPRALGRMLAARPEDREWRIRKRKSRIEILSYRPERRVVARWLLSEKNDASGEKRARSLVLRVHANALASQRDLFSRLADRGVLAPQWVASPEERIHVETNLDGASFAFDERPTSVEIGEMGTVLSRVHTVPWSPHTPGGLDATALLVAARAACAELSRIAPQYARRADEALAKLSRSGPDSRTSSLLHGDLHVAQFLRTRDGLALLDWDRARRGPAADDVGNLVIHLQVTGATQADIELLLDAYQSGGAHCARREIEWYRRAHALRVLDLWWRRPASVRPNWPARLLDCLDSGRLT